MTIVDQIEQIRKEINPGGNTSERIADILMDIFMAMPTTLPASDVHPWAKQPQKPTYSPNEIGAEPSGAVSAHNLSEEAHPDIRLLIANGGLTAVRSISVNGQLIELDEGGNANIVLEDVPELNNVLQKVSDLVTLNIFNRINALELSNPDVKVSATLQETQDGIRQNFTLNKYFITGSTQVWVNGVKLTLITDYVEIDNAGIGFIDYAPKHSTDVQILVTNNPV
jgi:hypothetical protein